MILHDTGLEEFAAGVRGQDKKIVIYGAGVIGKVTLPVFMEDMGLADRILFIADADSHKYGTPVRIAGRDIEICSPDRMNDIREDFAVLVTGSRHESILRYLEKIKALSGTDVYVFPQMLVRRARFSGNQKIEQRTVSPVIPKVIHYCWFGGKEIPDRLKRYMESWSRFCPDYRIVEWNEGNYDVGRHVYTRQAFQHKKWGFIPDIARLEILYEHGGIYLDTDVELVRGLDALLYQPGFVSVEKWGVINIGGGCGAVPGHPMIRKILEYRLAFPFEYEDGSLNLESSGSYESKPFLDRGFRPDNTVQTVGDMTVYTSDFFHPFDYMSKEMCMTENTYGIHHFSGSWI